MYNHKPMGKRLYGPAGAALVASLAMVGGSFVAATATAATASADPTTTSTTTSSVPVTTSLSLSQIQEKAADAIAYRVDALGAAIKVVQGDSFLGSDGTTLVTNMQADISGLQALGTKIAGDNSVPVALADYRSVFTTFRVVWFVLPDAWLVVRADSLVNVQLPAVQKVVTTLQGELTGGVPEYAVRLVGWAQARYNAAATALTGVSSQLLGFTAAEWNANPHLLDTDAHAVKSAAWDVDVARFDLAKARFDIERFNRHHHGHGHGTTTTTSTVPTSTTSTSTTTTTTTPTTTSSTTSTTVAGKGRHHHHHHHHRR